MSSDEVSPPRVILLGMALVALGTLGFHEIPGMIADDAKGTKLVNAVYCAVMTLTTVGFGDICPGENIQGPGRTFIVLLSFAGLGMFCGPVMGLAASWKDTVADKISLLSFMVATSIFVFSYLLEEMSQTEAAYFGIITGTTIGYGDISPKSDWGKLAVAAYALLSINVMASVLEGPMGYLLSFCQVPNEPIISKLSKAAAAQKEESVEKEKYSPTDGQQKEPDASANDVDKSSKSKTKKKKKRKGKKPEDANEENAENKKDN